MKREDTESRFSDSVGSPRRVRRLQEEAKEENELEKDDDFKFFYRDV